jgi:ribosomal protein L20A (L18A)
MRQPIFQKASSRKGCRIERVVEDYKECRALDTRYEKIAMDCGVLRMVAMIERILQLEE